jgi:type II secretory pathway pseudopilin PulG
VTARDRTVLIVVLVLAAIAGAWLLVVGPKRDQASSLSSQVSAAQTQLDTARGQIAQGEAARSAFSRSYTELARLGQAVPQDDNVPSLIYQLQGAASGAAVDFRDLTLTPGPTTAAAAAPASATQASVATLPPGVTVGPAGFPTEAFTFKFRGNFFHLADFFKRIQRFVTATNRDVSISGRLISLNAFSLGAAPAPYSFPTMDAAISATTYLVPASQGLLGGASPIAPGSGSAAQTVPASTSTSTSTPTAAPAAALTSPAK